MSTQSATIKLIAGDASDRKFFRCDDGENTSICMQFPKWEGGYGGDPISWIEMQSALTKMEIPVPKILKIDETEASIWTEDLGDNFLNSTNTESILDINNKACAKAIQFYKKSLSLLVKAQYPEKIIDSPAAQRLFDFEKLYYELNFFVTHFLNGLMELNIVENEEEDGGIGLFSDLKLLAKKLDEYSKVLCHRDYHVRNLMIKEDEVYWIDFQDARMGPHSYDVVSLVRDSYVNITWETRHELFNYYLSKINLARKSKDLLPISETDFRMESLLMGLQRNIKAIGSFGYLFKVKNKSSYLQYIKPTLDIISSPEARTHPESDLKNMMPNLFQLIERLHSGDLSSSLTRIINNYS